ncbi:MAG: hypothetical protein P1U42_02315 [Phycisphaerales bacterium]|jgi:hypothetical protein|nr:hypothetical protein [Phycisphaerales bacterium]
MRHLIFFALCFIAVLTTLSHAQDQKMIEESLSLEGWAPETFSLPPGFAPEMPTGSETLRFAPGWRDPSSENFWSYAFVMWIDEDVPDSKRVIEIIEIYYNGLMTVFASNKGKEASLKPVQVEIVKSVPNQFELKMNLIDAFATFKPVDIQVLVKTVVDTEGHSFVTVQLSQQPRSHKIWKYLDAAIKDIGYPRGEEDESKSEETLDD